MCVCVCVIISLIISFFSCVSSYYAYIIDSLQVMYQVGVFISRSSVGVFHFRWYWTLSVLQVHVHVHVIVHHVYELYIMSYSIYTVRSFCVHTHAHMYTSMHAHAQTHVDTHTHTHTHTYTHTHTHTHTHSYVHTHMHTHTHTHTLTCTHTHTHTHTNTGVYLSFLLVCHNLSHSSSIVLVHHIHCHLGGSARGRSVCQRIVYYGNRCEFEM